MSDTPETDALRDRWNSDELIHVEDIFDLAESLERERDARKEQLHAALMLGKMQERRHARELKEIREQYRLSSVCREKQAQIDMLRKLMTAYELEKEKQDGREPEELTRLEPQITLPRREWYG